jgi:hypothetical protein
VDLEPDQLGGGGRLADRGGGGAGDQLAVVADRGGGGTAAR